MAQRRRTREDWQRLVEGWPRSGLTQSQYCERHGVSVGSLHRWREQLRGAPGAGARVGGVESTASLRLLPVELLAEAPAAGEAALTLVLGARLRLQIAPGFDAPTLQRVVALLREGGAP
jgi:transposase-like protein